MLTKWYSAPIGGEAPDLPPDQVGPLQARSLRNLLVHNPGRVSPRGNIGGPGAAEVGAVPHSTGAPMAGHLVYEDEIALSYRAASASPLVDPWRVPINRPTSGASLTQPVIGTAAVRNTSMLTGATADITAGSPELIHGYRYARIADYTYSVSLGGVSTSITTGVGQRTQLNKVGRTNGAFLTTGPHFVQDVIGHYNRVFVAGAVDPGVAGGTGYDPSKLYYSVLGGTVGILDQLADWQDPVSGELNKIQVGTSNDGDFIVALGRANGHLVIFKRKSVWILYGTSIEDFTLRQLRTQSGCVDPRSVVTADDGVYFASQLGFEVFDGTDFKLLSRPVQDTWLEFSNRGPNATSINHSYIQVTALPNDYLHISFGTDPVTVSTTDGAERNWLFYMPTGAWIDFTCAISSLGMNASKAFNRATVTAGTITLWGASEWARADLLPYGPDLTLGLVDRDASTSFNVDLKWQTYLDNLGASRGADGRWITSTLLHLTADYRHNFQNSTPADRDAFGTLLGTDGFGASLVPALNVPGYKLSSSPLRVRPMFDANQESNRGDLSLTLQSDIGSSSSLRTARFYLYGLGVMYDPGRERRLD